VIADTKALKGLHLPHVLVSRVTGQTGEVGSVVAQPISPNGPGRYTGAYIEDGLHGVLPISVHPDHRGFTIHELDENGKSVPVEYEAIRSDASHLRVHRPSLPTRNSSQVSGQNKRNRNKKTTIDWMGCVRQNRATWLPLKSVIQKLTPSLHAPHGPVAAPATVPIGVRSAAFQSDTLSPEKFVIRIR